MSGCTATMGVGFRFVGSSTGRSWFPTGSCCRRTGSISGRWCTPSISWRPGGSWLRRTRYGRWGVRGRQDETVSQVATQIDPKTKSRLVGQAGVEPRRLSRRFYRPGFLRPRTFADVRRVYKLPLLSRLIVRRRTPSFVPVAVKSLSENQAAAGLADLLTRATTRPDA
jgi:hypothetical protein